VVSARQAERLVHSEERSIPPDRAGASVMEARQEPQRNRAGTGKGLPVVRPDHGPVNDPVGLDHPQQASLREFGRGLVSVVSELALVPTTLRVTTSSMSLIVGKWGPDTMARPCHTKNRAMSTPHPTRGITPESSPAPSRPATLLTTIRVRELTPSTGVRMLNLEQPARVSRGTGRGGASEADP
jgi:hypothetical protein